MYKHIILAYDGSATGQKALVELRELTLDAITVDDFDTEELRSAGYRAPTQPSSASREAACTGCTGEVDGTAVTAGPGAGDQTAG